jgi:hypothetical protein
LLITDGNLSGYHKKKYVCKVILLQKLSKDISLTTF